MWYESWDNAAFVKSEGLRMGARIVPKILYNAAFVKSEELRAGARNAPKNCRKTYFFRLIVPRHFIVPQEHGTFSTLWAKR